MSIRKERTARKEQKIQEIVKEAKSLLWKKKFFAECSIDFDKNLFFTLLEKSKPQEKQVIRLAYLEFSKEWDALRANIVKKNKEFFKPTEVGPVGKVGPVGPVCTGAAGPAKEEAVAGV